MHKTVFEIVKAIISKEVPEDTLQSLLKVSERIINLAGVFGDSPTAGVYIKLLCRHCMPGAGQMGLGHRHVQINKMILNTANCLGSKNINTQIFSALLAGSLSGKPSKTTLYTTIAIN